MTGMLFYWGTQNAVFPRIIVAAMIMSTLGALSLYFINKFALKISAHAYAAWFIVGFVLVLFSYYKLPSVIAIVVTITLATLITQSRIYLKSHTPTEAIWGMILGFLLSYVGLHVLEVYI